MFTNLVAQFPRILDGSGYQRTSFPTRNYNCVAWAFGDDKKWWEPDPFGLLYWPKDVRRTYALRDYIKLCEIHGYVKCADGEKDDCYEKVAIYTVGDEFRHIARQLPSGLWTSKIGEQDDISHTLNGLGGSSYGTPTVFFRRKITL